jgi:Tfp pilus assembly protein PilP
VAIFIFSTLFYSENVYSHENIEILERYVLEELALSDIRWNTDNKAWKACFKTPSGFYVTTFASQSIGKLGMIMNIDKLSVTVRQYFPINEDETEWDERYIRLELPENYFCDWKYSVPNYAVPPEY